MSDTIIKVEGVSKKYCRSLKHTMMYGVSDLSKSFLGLDQQTERLRDGEFWALNDVSFEVKQGEALGLIGLNGSGKSTLLKMLNGIMMPDKGRIEITGRIGALIEVGAGFHPMLTGRENIYINGAIIGMTKKEIDKKFDVIVDFAGIDNFIDSPVKHYSSGMYVRLGFAIAAHAEIDILLVDEVLAVGDIKFQQKCIRKMNEFKENGKTCIMTTHDMSMLKTLCATSVWLDKGKVFQEGRTGELSKSYYSQMHYEKNTVMTKPDSCSDSTGPFYGISGWENVKACAHFGEGGAEIIRVALSTIDNRQAVKSFVAGQIMVLSLEIGIKTDISRPLIGAQLNDEYGNHIFGLNNYIASKELRSFKKGERIFIDIQFKFPKIQNGEYSISVAIADGTQQSHVQHHWVHDAYKLQIVDVDGLGNFGCYLIIDDIDIHIKPEEC
jgi:ABC-type polysaccharide/polyol phosphate transport system ATPase subunit